MNRPLERPSSVDGPIFTTMILDWGLPLAGIPWTGLRPRWGDLDLDAIRDAIHAAYISGDPDVTDPIPIKARHR